MIMMTRNWALLAAAGLVLAVAGCGGGSSGSGTTAGSNVTPVASDSFLSQVLAITATTSEDGPPVSTDAISVTTPETTVPGPLG